MVGKTNSNDFLGKVYFVTFKKRLTKAEQLEYNDLFSNSLCYTMNHSTFRSHIFFAPQKSNTLNIENYIQSHGGVFSIQYVKNNEQDRQFLAEKIISVMIEEFNKLKRAADEIKIYAHRPTKYKNLTKKLLTMKEQAKFYGDLLKFNPRRIHSFIDNQIEDINNWKIINTTFR